MKIKTLEWIAKNIRAVIPGTILGLSFLSGAPALCEEPDDIAEMQEEKKDDDGKEDEKKEEKPAKEYTNEELDRIIRMFERSNLVDGEGIVELKDTVTKEEKWIKEYDKKYGAIDKPLLSISPEYNFKPVDYKKVKIASLKKDVEYYNLLLELYTVASKVYNDYLGVTRFAGEEYAQGLCPDLEKLIKEEGLAGKTFVIRSDGKAKITIKSSLDFLKLIYMIAAGDSENAGNSDFLLNFLVQCNILDEMRTKHPKLLELVADKEKIRLELDAIAKQIISGYTDRFPKLVVHASEDDFMKQLEPSKKENSHKVGAFHKISTDTIETFAKELYLNIIHMAHEYGHPICRASENEYFEMVNSGRKILDLAEGIIADRAEAADICKKIKTQKDPEIKKQLRLQLDLRLISVKHMVSSLNALITMQKASQSLMNALRIGQFAFGQGPIDEACAYLMQDMMLNEYARKNPEIGTMLLQLRDLFNAYERDGEHYGAYRLAQFLKEKYSGDTVKAFNELAFLTDEKKLKEYADIVIEYNSANGIGLCEELRQNADAIKFVRKFQNAEDEAQILEEEVMTCRRMQLKLREKKELSEEEKNLILTKKRRLEENQKLLPGLYKRYLEMMYK